MVQRPRIHEKKNETNHETISHRFEIQQIPVESQTRQDLGEEDVVSSTCFYRFFNINHTCLERRINS